MSGRAWGAVAVLLAVVLVFAPRRAQEGRPRGCAALAEEGANLAQQAVGIVDVVETIERITTREVSGSGARRYVRLMEDFTEAAEVYARQAARLEDRIAAVCGS